MVTTPHTWYHKQHASITFVSMSPSQHEPYEAQVTIRKTMFKHQKNDNSSTYSEPNFRGDFYGTFQISKPPSNTLQTPFKHPSNTLQTPFKHTSDIPQIPIKHSLQKSTKESHSAPLQSPFSTFPRFRRRKETYKKYTPFWREVGAGVLCCVCHVVLCVMSVMCGVCVMCRVSVMCRVCVECNACGGCGV